jgi:hypothetical protein
MTLTGRANFVGRTVAEDVQQLADRLHGAFVVIEPGLRVSRPTENDCHATKSGTWHGPSTIGSIAISTSLGYSVYAFAFCAEAHA